jgi:hypothetical protein
MILSPSLSASSSIASQLHRLSVRPPQRESRMNFPSDGFRIEMLSGKNQVRYIANAHPGAVE